MNECLTPDAMFGLPVACDPMVTFWAYAIPVLALSVTLIVFSVVILWRAATLKTEATPDERLDP